MTENADSLPPRVGRDVVPFAALTPGACGIVADVAAQAMAAFAAQGIPVPKQVQLRQAIATLRRIASTRSWGTSTSALATSGAALSVAGDLILIAQCLRGDPIKAVADEMGEALTAALPTLARVGGYDLQSQYWFGMVLARAGLRPRIPVLNERRPDFVISADTFEFGVEHKRPQSWRSARRALDTAARQLRDYGRKHHSPGLIVLDLSDAMGLPHLVGERIPADDALRHNIGSVLQHRADLLDERVVAHRHASKYARIVGLICYARALAWHEQVVGLVPTFTVWVATYVMDHGSYGIAESTVRRAFSSVKRTIQEFADGPIRQIHR